MSLHTFYDPHNDTPVWGCTLQGLLALPKVVESDHGQVLALLSSLPQTRKDLLICFATRVPGMLASVHLQHDRCIRTIDKLIRELVEKRWIKIVS
jgi:hypothetical protein